MKDLSKSKNPAHRVHIQTLEMEMADMIHTSLKPISELPKAPATNSINDLPRNMYDATQDPFSTVR